MARKRFSLGHELGHIFLNHKKNLDAGSTQAIVHKRDVKSASGKYADEVEANFFAATLLMPRREIDDSINFEQSFDDNVKIIANKFGVSQAAATLRLKYLGYIPAP